MEAVTEATNAVAGHDENKGVTDVELRLHWQSKGTSDFDIIDLPGLVINAMSMQPKDIPEQIKDIVKKYCKDEHMFIMCICSAASVDTWNFSALKVAKEVDKELNRTVVVITKLDEEQSPANEQDILKRYQANLIDFCPIDIFLLVNNRETKSDTSDVDTLEVPKKSEEGIVQRFRMLPQIYKKSFKLGMLELWKCLTSLLVDNFWNALPSLKNRLAHLRPKSELKVQR
ncbi:Dynamin-related protein DNM1 [Tetrabaena socialis]|uniref:Dynamin-related protein DNM1 n=1 Tax=Tetrabaena socialis TaxID=47790 RepID=A0A2J7ZK12_9CHLO|nr:Dynamin-related protein DNM1 [Tetrabaena socialis]|eukprot:PNH00597.1 Dynamin-related protein DNM1 [Tetrabaena socialis]